MTTDTVNNYERHDTMHDIGDDIEIHFDKMNDIGDVIENDCIHDTSHDMSDISCNNVEYFENGNDKSSWFLVMLFIFIRKHIFFLHEHVVNCCCGLPHEVVVNL